jgi:Polyketide cyclase / dehydrase and lipid transport
MLRVFQTIEIQAPADEVWRLAGRLEGIAEFHPEVTAARVHGGFRRCTLVGGGEVVERIVDHSVVHRFYTVELAGGDSPFGGYRTCLAVRGHGDHSHVDWDVELATDRTDAGCELARGVDEAAEAALETLRAQVETRVAA